MIATFTGTAQADHGQQLVSSPGSCVSGWETATFAPDANGALKVTAPSGHDIVLVKAVTR